MFEYCLSSMLSHRTPALRIAMQVQVRLFARRSCQCRTVNFFLPFTMGALKKQNCSSTDLSGLSSWRSRRFDWLSKYII